MAEVFNVSEWMVDRHVAEGRGSRVAVICEGRETSYLELQAAVWAAANGFLELGVGVGDRVVLILNDSAAFAAAFCGAMRVGAVAVPLSTMLTAKDQAAIAADATPKVLVVSAEYAERVPSIVAAAPDLVAAIVVDDGGGPAGGAGAGARAGGGVAGGAGAGGGVAGGGVALLAWGALADTSERAPAATRADTPAFWLYTSGTTGSPKGAIHLHDHLQVIADTYGRTVLAAGEPDRFYSVAKLFFAFGLGNSLAFPFAVGATTILDPARPTPARVVQNLVEHRPTLFFASPGFCAALLDTGAPAGAFASVRLMATAGEALPAPLWARMDAAYGVTVLDGIGSTEATHIFCSNHPGAVRPGTSGTPVAGYELKLVDESGAEIATADTPGFLHLRGGSVAAGYWARPDATAASFIDGWLKTGDVYTRSADGYYRFLGRNNDMIKAGGIWVSPAEVETVLLLHDDVLEAAVVGSHDGQGLETVVAFVVARAGRTIDPAALEAHCRASMAAFKRPRRIVVIDGLPKTATGKVQRFALRDRLSALDMAAAVAGDDRY